VHLLVDVLIARNPLSNWTQNTFFISFFLFFLTDEANWKGAVT